MTGDAARRSDRMVRLSHWSAAALIGITVSLGFWMTSTYAAAQGNPDLQPRLHLLAAMHHTLGFTIFILAGVWAMARVAGGRCEVATPIGPWQAALAKTVHAILFLLLMLLPLSGWAALSAFGEFPIYFGGY